MRRILCVAILAFCSTAFGQSSKSLYNVADYGAVAGDMSGESTDRALEAIRAEILSRDATSGMARRYLGATIHFPASLQPWVVSRPHFIDRDRWVIEGEGRETTKVVTRQNWQHSAFIFGFPRSPAKPWSTYPNAVLTPDFHPDAYGILDVTAAPAVGSRWGIKITPEVTASLPVSPFSHGPGDGRRYAGLRQHLVEAFIVPSDPTKPLPIGDLFGFGDWVVSGSGNNLNTVRLTFKTAGGTSQAFDMTLGKVLPSYRLTFQVDHDAGQLQAYCNGVQYLTVPRPKNDGSFKPGSSYYANENYPFNIGFNSRAIDSNAGPGLVSFPPVPMTLYGLRMTDRPAYKDNGPGKPQERLDGLPVTDATRYFDLNNGCFALLPLTDPPTSNPTCKQDGRFIEWIAPCKPYPTIRGYGMRTFYHGSNTWPTTQQNAIRDISVWTAGDRSSVGSGGFGQAISVGSVVGFSASRVDALGGGHGIGSLNVGPCWGVTYDNLRIGGTEAGLYAYWQVFTARDVFQLTVQRAGIRALGSAGNIRGVFFGETCPITDANIYLHGDEYGGMYRLESVMCDTEQGGGPNLAAVVMEAHPWTACRLRVSDLDLGQIPAGSSPILLRDCPLTQDSTTPFAVIDGLSVWSNKHRATVVRQSGKWGVTVTGDRLSGNAAKTTITIPGILDEFKDGGK